MGWRVDPEKVAHATGPNCEGCLFRDTSRGFVVTQGIEYRKDGDKWVWYNQSPMFGIAKYMFIADPPGKAEVKIGQPSAGETGGIFNLLLHSNTDILRPEVVISPVVRCRPIKYISDGDGGQVPITQKNGDYINEKPSPEQIQECDDRYGSRERDGFNGTTIVGMGSVALSAYDGH